MSPAILEAGKKVSVAVEGFAPGAGLRLSFDHPLGDNDNPTIRAQAVADARGAATLEFVQPVLAGTTGCYQLAVTGPGGANDGVPYIAELVEYR